MAVNIKRIYDSPSAEDGYRVLVDRLWPRGVGKDKAQLDLWLKDAAPSAELRQWFGHEPAKFKEFRVRYQAELDKNQAVGQLKEIIQKHRKLTLLYAARDPKINHAVVLREYLGQS